MKRLLAIITDDLTSAMDCGIQVAQSGLDTLVLLGEYKAYKNTHDFSVISIDTNTRSLTQTKAYRIVKEAAVNMRADGYKDIYKSLDSTLRGNLGTEIDAVMDVYDFDFAAVAPAFPHYGRTTTDGRHYLRGVPLTQTEFSKDPTSPVKEDDLIKLFSTQSKRSVGLLKLDTLRSGEKAVSEQISSLISQEVELVIFDVQEEEDLDRIVQTVSKTDYRVLWVGSTGLARCVPQAIDYKKRKTPRREAKSYKSHGMLVSGSTSEITKTQIDFLKKQSGVSTVEMKPQEIIHGGERALTEMKRCRSWLLDALKKGNDVALHVPPSRDEVVATKARGRELGLTEEQVPTMISEALADITEQTINAIELSGLILTGGDTAKTICNRLGSIGIELLEEVEPGIPIGNLVGPVELQVITKAGGFGTPQVLVNSLKMLRRR